MFARTTKLQLQSGKMDEFQRLFQEVIAPGLQQQPGFRSITLLADESTGQVLGTTQWDRLIIPWFLI